MHRYAHVGYAKAASTWLQAFLFPCHPDLCHLGRHNHDEIPDEGLRIALWNDLITRPSFLYDPQEVGGTFDRLFATAETQGARACGISQEVLTLSLIGRLDLTERARRLREAMGDGTRVVIVVRNQLDWIRSLYCGLLSQGGLTLDLDEFLFYFYYQQDQSPLSDLFYDDVYALYAGLFGDERVHVVPFEMLSRSAREFADAICAAIGVPALTEVVTQRINERPSPRALTACLEYNRKHRFYFGTHPFRRPWAFAAAPIYGTRCGIDPPDWVGEERAKSLGVFEHMEAMVREADAQGKPIPPMDTTIPDRYAALLSQAYAPHNRRLRDVTGVDVATLGYPV